MPAEPPTPQAEVTAQNSHSLQTVLSLRSDTAHTPFGILKWCIKQYTDYPLLKAPSHIPTLTNGEPRGLIGSHFKGTRVPAVRQLHSKVLYILSRITPQKFNELLDELLQLPLRQSDDAELKEVVNVFFEKASEEPEYSSLYTKLVEVLCTHPDRTLKESSAPTYSLSSRFQSLFAQIWEQRLFLDLSLSADEKQDRSTGEALGDEEVNEKLLRMKRKLVGNLKFIAELISAGVIPTKAISVILQQLIGNVDPDAFAGLSECTCELFAVFLKAIGLKLHEFDSELLGHYFGIAKLVQQAHPRCRVQFMMEELESFRIQKGWPISSEVSSVPSPSSKRSNSPIAESFGGLSVSSNSFATERSLLHRSEHPFGRTPESSSSLHKLNSSFPRSDKPNPLVHYLHKQEDRSLLTPFGALPLHQKQECIFDFLNIILCDEPQLSPQIVRLFSALIPQYIKAVTLSCFIVSYMRDVVPTMNPGVMDGIVQLYQSTLTSSAFSDLLPINFFNLILLKLEKSSDTLEAFVNAAYPAVSSGMSLQPGLATSSSIGHLTEPSEIISSASMSTFRFLYAVAVNITAAGGRRAQPIHEIMNKYPKLTNSMELTLFSLVTHRASNWVDLTVKTVMDSMATARSKVHQTTIVMSAVDALLTATAVPLPSSTLLTISDATKALSSLLIQLKNTLCDAAVLLELIIFCNSYSVRVKQAGATANHCAQSPMDRLRQLFTLCVQSGGFVHREQALQLLTNCSDQTIFDMYYTSLSTRKGMTLIDAVDGLRTLVL